MDFSENIAIKTKHEVQEAHFSGKQYALHCSIVEPGENKFVYHLSDDTTHDPSFVFEVLEDIFDRWEIRNETVIIKSDNAPTQYKNKWAFHSYHSLANKYDVRIIRLYGAAGHGKGLIDAMSAFGVKSILRRDIIGLDVWFVDSQAIRDYLDIRKDPRMSYTVVSQKQVDKKRMARVERKIDGCMAMHLFEYKPNENSVYMKEFLCDCDNCLNLEFDACLRVDGPDESQMDEVEESVENDDDCYLDEEQDRGQHIFEFVSIPCFIAVISFNSCEPIYFIKVIEKGVATDVMRDRYGHSINSGECFLRGNYLKSDRSRNMALKRFSIVPGDVLCDPVEVFEAFVDIDHDSLCMPKDIYAELVLRAS